MSARGTAVTYDVDTHSILEAMNAAGSLSRIRPKSSWYSGWAIYRADSPETILVVEGGPETPQQLDRLVVDIDSEAAVLYARRGTAVLRLASRGHMVTVPMRTGAEAEAVCGALSRCKFGESPDSIRMAMDAVPTPRPGFSNDGVLPAGYVQNHILTQVGRTDPADTPWATLHRLRWGVDAGRTGDGTVSRGTASGDVCIMVRGGGGPLPEMEAWAALDKHRWAILVQGTVWSLYRAGSPALGSFTIDVADGAGALYLKAAFAASSFGSGLIGKIVDADGAKRSESRLVRRIMRGGVFTGLAGGLAPDGPLSAAELRRVKDAATTMLYRIWFVSQAEARGILPLDNPEYYRISLRAMQDRTFRYESDPGSTACWEGLQRLFGAIRDGDERYGAGGCRTTLFEGGAGNKVANAHLVDVLRMFSVKYGTHEDTGHAAMGSVYEALAGARLTQQYDGSVRMWTGAGYRHKKSMAAYYTPRILVNYLALTGLQPVLEDRQDAAGTIAEMLDLRVLDPTAGSGRFLIEALDVIAGWAAATLAGRPDDASLRELVGEAPPGRYGARLRRAIAQRCMFGVDLDPRAAELTRISLWLASGSRRPVGDGHIKVGDATMGMWLEDLRHAKAGSLDRFTAAPPPRTIPEQKAVLDALAAAIIDGKVRGRSQWRNLTPASPRRAAAVAEEYGLFHWEVEMPDAFKGRRGFDVILGNPPWGQIKLEMVDLYNRDGGTFEMLGRRKNQDTIRAMTENSYKKRLAELRARATRGTRIHAAQYEMGRGPVNTYWLVLNKMISLVAEGGTVSAVVPAQLANSIKNAPIRRRLFEMNIRYMYFFENSLSIFPIDRRFRFMIFSARASPGPDTYPAGFYLRRPESLYDRALEPDKFTILSKRFIRQTSPTYLNIPEMMDTALCGVYSKMCRNGMLMEKGRNGWKARRYTHMSKHTSLVYGPPPYPAGQLPTVSGKNIQHYNYKYVPLDKATDTRAFRKAPRTDRYMLVGRAVTGSTNTRTAITAVLPPGHFADTTLFALELTDPSGRRTETDRIAETLCLEGIYNSLAFDFLARTLVNNHLEGVILSLPVPPPSELDAQIARRAAMLTVDGSAHFDELAGYMGIANKAVDGDARIRVAAEIEAMVARGYGLDADEYSRLSGSFFPDSRRAAHSPNMRRTMMMKRFGMAVRDMAVSYMREGRTF